MEPPSLAATVSTRSIRVPFAERIAREIATVPGPKTRSRKAVP
jgi:hypothetical protein